MRANSTLTAKFREEDFTVQFVEHHLKAMVEALFRQAENKSGLNAMVHSMTMITEKIENSVKLKVSLDLEHTGEENV